MTKTNFKSNSIKYLTLDDTFWRKVKATPRLIFPENRTKEELRASIALVHQRLEDEDEHKSSLEKRLKEAYKDCANLKTAEEKISELLAQQSDFPAIELYHYIYNDLNKTAYSIKDAHNRVGHFLKEEKINGEKREKILQTVPKLMLVANELNNTSKIYSLSIDKSEKNFLFEIITYTELGFSENICQTQLFKKYEAELDHVWINSSGSGGENIDDVLENLSDLVTTQDIYLAELKLPITIPIRVGIYTKPKPFIHQRYEHFVDLTDLLNK